MILGASIQEIEYWTSLRHVLKAIKQHSESVNVHFTLEVLNHANATRFSATAAFESAFASVEKLINLAWSIINLRKKLLGIDFEEVEYEEVSF
jgi:hypothetical protein